MSFIGIIVGITVVEPVAGNAATKNSESTEYAKNLNVVWVLWPTTEMLNIALIAKVKDTEPKKKSSGIISWGARFVGIVNNVRPFRNSPVFEQLTIQQLAYANNVTEKGVRKERIN